MRNKVKTHVFNGVKFHIDVDCPYWGWCDNPDKENNEDEYPGIRMTDGLPFGNEKNAKRGLIVLLHECLHAEQWELTEDEVDRISTEIGTLFWRLGYRRHKK